MDGTPISGPAPRVEPGSSYRNPDSGASARAPKEKPPAKLKAAAASGETVETDEWDDSESHQLDTMA